MKKIFTILFIILGGSAVAQQDPLFSQYMFNKMALNPGYAGSREVIAADVLYRYQWVKIDGAPKTISASIHSPLKNPHLAVGLNMYNDKLGPLSYTGAMATFAYRILFPNGKLSFGLQAGIKNNGIVINQFVVSDEDDPFLNSSISKKIIPDANFGVYYSSDKFYIGFSTKQLLQNQSLVVVDNTGNKQFTQLKAHFYSMAGCVIPVGENVVFRPSLLAKFVSNAPPQLDLNASFLFNNSLWLGASYRTVKAISLISEFNITQSIRLGYSYDIWFNQLKNYNSGSHEIRLSFEINNNKRLLTPRYF